MNNNSDNDDDQLWAVFLIHISEIQTTIVYIFHKQILM